MVFPGHVPRERSTRNAAVISARKTLALLAAAALAHHAAAQSFTLISPPAGQTAAVVNGMSADGSVIAGYSTNNNDTRSFTWTLAGGRNDIGFSPGFPTFNGVNAISGNGRAVVGSSSAVLQANSARAFRWSDDGTYQSLGVQGGYGASTATGISGDGSVVIGRSYTTQQGAEVAAQAFRWTASGGMQPLGFTRPSSGYSTASGVSRDGSVVVGTSKTGTQSDAFRWVSDSGMTVLNGLPGSTQSRASAVDSTGSLIVGSCGLNAVLWRNGVPQDLGLALGYQRSSGYGLSEGASVIISNMQSNSGGILSAGVWTEQTGMILLEDYLRARGTPIPSTFRLDNVTGISADGQTFAGYSVSGSIAYGWVATVPAPATALLFVGLLAPRRRPR